MGSRAFPIGIPLCMVEALHGGGGIPHCMIEALHGGGGIPHCMVEALHGGGGMGMGHQFLEPSLSL